MNRASCVILLAALLAASTASGKDFNNGCGSDWNEPLVPDTLKPLCIDFRSPCAEHDNCYSRCLTGGANYGKPVCSQTASEQREGRRLNCDDSFLADMDNKCSQCDPLRRPICKGIAFIYRLAVGGAGSGSFNGSQVPESFYLFLASEKARDFDFAAFEREITQIRRIPGVEASNFIQLEMKDGKPIAAFRSRFSVPLSSFTLKSGTLRVTESTTYGNIDLSAASLDGHAFRIDKIDVKKLDLRKFQKMQRFESINR